jgi:arylamine N-acetyltransferase
MTIATLLLTVSCKSTFNASETLQNDENRKELYQTIISDSSKFSEFLDVAANNKDAQMLLMKNHMKMMEDGKMMEMMKDNPEMKKKMEQKMQEMMEKNPEMKNMMMMMMKMMEKMQENPEMMKKMKEMEMKDKKHSGHQ